MGWDGGVGQMAFGIVQPTTTHSPPATNLTTNFHHHHHPLTTINFRHYHSPSSTSTITTTTTQGVLGNMVEFTGSVAATEVPQLLASFDVFLYPAFGESFG